MDLQAILPQGSFPSALQRLPQFYLDMSGDPLIAGAMGLHGAPTQFTWFYTFLVIEEYARLSAIFNTCSSEKDFFSSRYLF